MAEKAPEWRLSTAEFARLWDAQGGPEFPTEFAQPTWGAYPDTAAVSRARSENTGGERRKALIAFTRPRCSITVRGIDAARPYADPSHHVRMLAAWSSHEYAYLARQTPGETLGAPGTMVITRHPAQEIVRAAIDHLPPAVGAGRLRTDMDVRFANRPLAGDATVREVVPDHEFRSAAHAFAPGVPAGTCGSITIRAGSITDDHQPTVLETRYRDVPGDGRYFLVLDRPGVAVAAEGEYLAQLLHRLVNGVRKRHEADIAEREAQYY